MQARIQEMEAEAQKLREMQAQVEKEMHGGSANGDGMPLALPNSQQLNLAYIWRTENKEDVDARSIYIGNVSASSLVYAVVELYQLTPIN